MNIQQTHHQVRNELDESSDGNEDKESIALTDLAEAEATRGNDHTTVTKKRRCATNLTSHLTGAKTRRAVH